MGRVEGKVVAITGAARGQGRSHAVRLAEEGADIIAIDICRDIDVVEYPMGTEEELQETAHLVEKAGRRAVVRQADIRDRAALDSALADGVSELGKLDVVVANAAIAPVGPGRPVSAFADTVDVNLSGTLNTVHAALPHLPSGSSIILISSAAAALATHGDPAPMGPGGNAYSFSKQVLVTYVNWFTQFLAPSGIRINAVLPANVDTVMIHNEAMYRIFRPDLEQAKREDAEPAFHMVHAMALPYVAPLDVSHAVTYLASDESRYVTGTQVRVDAGSVIKFGK